MQDFNDYLKNGGGKKVDNDNNTQQSLINLVTKLASKYDGKNTSELINAIYYEAKRGKQNGTLTNRDIDNFASMLAPMLDDRKRKMLYKITEELKQI
jgi:hypothetical protein